MPRRYQMATRERAVQDTRQRIIDAAISLHAQRGVIATNWEEIAERASVSTATVYRHFPSLGELIQAALGDAFVDAQTMSVIKALIDFPFWKALTDAGVAAEKVPRVINDLVRSRLQKRR